MAFASDHFTVEMHAMFLKSNNKYELPSEGVQDSQMLAHENRHTSKLELLECVRALWA